MCEIKKFYDLTLKIPSKLLLPFNFLDFNESVVNFKVDFFWNRKFFFFFSVKMRLKNL